MPQERWVTRNSLQQISWCSKLAALQTAEGFPARVKDRERRSLVAGRSISLFSLARVLHEATAIAIGSRFGANTSAVPVKVSPLAC
jgi:hypothetical protein